MDEDQLKCRESWLEVRKKRNNTKLFKRSIFWRTEEKKGSTLRAVKPLIGIIRRTKKALP